MIPIGDSKNSFYTFFYDESNNARKFYIKNDKNIFNLQNDPNQEAKLNFCLAGIAFKGSITNSRPEELIKSLNIPVNHQGKIDLKLRQIANGNFLQITKSEKLLRVFKWLTDSDILIHYFHLDMLYWSFVDIVEDCVFHCEHNGYLQFEEIPYDYYVRYHKDVLNEVIKSNTSTFIKLLKTFDFPNVKENPVNFLTSLLRHIATYKGKLLIENKFRDDQHLIGIDSLMELIHLSEDIEHLYFVESERPAELINSFTPFYHVRLEAFKHSIHVFDEEFEVQDELQQSRKTHPTLDIVNYKFVNSASSSFIQISDVIAGVFGKYFLFIGSSLLEELKAIRENLNSYQLEFLSLMRHLIERTDDECPLMLYYVMSMAEQAKHKAFMFPDVE